MPQGAKMKNRFLAQCRNMRTKGEMFVNYDARSFDLISDCYWRGGNVNSGDSRK